VSRPRLRTLNYRRLSPRRCLQRRCLALVAVAYAAGGRRFLHPRMPRASDAMSLREDRPLLSVCETGRWPGTGVERNKAEWKRGEAVTVGVAVDGEVPSEPKNSAAIAMAPQFLAPCPPIALPSGEGSWVVAVAAVLTSPPRPLRRRRR
jgi:hypothetical protein